MSKFGKKPLTTIQDVQSLILDCVFTDIFDPNITILHHEPAQVLVYLDKAKSMYVWLRFPYGARIEKPKPPITAADINDLVKKSVTRAIWRKE